MNRRVVAAWVIAVAGSGALGALALQPPARHLPVVPSGPLFAARPALHSAGVGTSPAIGAGHLTTVTVTLADTGCQVSPSSFPGGPVTFRVINPGNTRVSEAEFRDQSGEKILGESEDVEPGAPESFSLLVAAGTYEMSCPGAGGPATKVTVTREQ